MDRSRIPGKIDKFDAYITNTDNYLQTDITPPHGIRLGMALANINKWHEHRTIWEELFKLRSNPLTKTTNVNKKIKSCIKNFKTFGQPQLRIIAASENATITDSIIFNFVLNRKKMSLRITEIKEKCFALYERLGGCKFNFKCRSDKNAKRAKLVNDAGGVEIAYYIGDKNEKPPKADLIVSRKLFTKATFIFDAELKNSGKYMYIYFRWYDFKRPELSGPWSNVQVIFIV